MICVLGLQKFYHNHLGIYCSVHAIHFLVKNPQPRKQHADFCYISHGWTYDLPDQAIIDGVAFFLLNCRA